MDFFEHQDQARRKTFWLVIAYVMAVAIIVVFVYAITGAAYYCTEEGRKYLGKRFWDPQLFVWTTGFTLVTILIGNIYKSAQLAGGGSSVALMLGGRLLSPGDCRTNERMVLNVVEEMSIASGIPVPPVYLLDEEAGINAFAAGDRPNNAVIGVSQGAIQYLSRDELQGVIAHEFSHILNGDMRLNVRLISTLHGILLLAYIGDALVRIVSNRNLYVSDRERDRDNRFELAVFLLGVALQMIGFVGVFFGSLIKSAVCKQREFLADASAVQFTRNPDGISGALKKIGGLAHGSRLKSARASQVSHMFFSSGVDASMINLFATHPPLEERIRRIDPNWDGIFPDSVLPRGLPEVALETANYQDSPTRQPRIAQQNETGQPIQPLQTAAFLGRWQAPSQQQQAVGANQAFDQVGMPGREHLEYASAFLAEIPAPLRSAIDEPMGAQAVVMLSLLDDESSIREKQLQILRDHLNVGIMKQVDSLLALVSDVPVELRLPLIELGTSSLRQLSAEQHREFRDLVQRLVDIDGKVNYFEFALLRSLDRHLDSHFRPKPPVRVEYRSLQPLLPACSTLLSIVAHVGSDNDPQATKAFYEAAMVLSPEGGLRLHHRSDIGVRRADISLAELAKASPTIKRKVLAACTACVAQDQKVTIEEAELLRAIADSLDCPIPPLLAIHKARAKNVVSSE